MAWYIHSTCGQSMVFKVFKPEAKGSLATVSTVQKDKKGVPLEITIGGGAYVLIKETGRTKKCFQTEVTDEWLEILHSNDAYMRMKARGFFTERQENHTVLDSQGNPDDMEKKDNTSQISDYDHAHGLDPRLDHAGTRATTGLNNQIGGEQPNAANEGNYGQILI